MQFAMDGSQLRDQIRDRVVTRDHGRKAAHHDVAGIGVGLEEAQQLVAIDAHNFNGVNGRCPGKTMGKFVH